MHKTHLEETLYVERYDLLYEGRSQRAFTLDPNRCDRIRLRARMRSEYCQNDRVRGFICLAM